jgi:hypothetical protein
MRVVLASQALRALALDSSFLVATVREVVGEFSCFE